MSVSAMLTVAMASPVKCPGNTDRISMPAATSMISMRQRNEKLSPVSYTHLDVYKRQLTYMVFSLVQMLMMMQCAQISRDRGINPVFIYGFFGGVAYIMQSAGFLLGWVSDFMWIGGREWLFIVAMRCV